jgi:hypothetical protein
MGGGGERLVREITFEGNTVETEGRYLGLFVVFLPLVSHVVKEQEDLAIPQPRHYFCKHYPFGISNALIVPVLAITAVSPNLCAAAAALSTVLLRWLGRRFFMVERRSSRRGGDMGCWRTQHFANRTAFQ